MALVRPPANAVVSISRALKRWGLEQGPNRDFRVSGKGEKACVIVYASGHRTIAERAADIARDTAGEFPWHVITDTVNGHPIVTVNQGPAPADGGQEPAPAPVVEEPAPAVVAPQTAVQDVQADTPRLPQRMSVNRSRTIPRDMWAVDCRRCTGQALKVSPDFEDPADAYMAAWGHYHENHRRTDETLTAEQQTAAVALGFSHKQHDALIAARAGRLMEDMKGIAYEDVTASKADVFRPVTVARVLGLVDAGFLDIQQEDGGRRWFALTVKGRHALALWELASRQKVVTFADRDTAHKATTARVRAWVPLAKADAQDTPAETPAAPPAPTSGMVAYKGRTITWKLVQDTRHGQTFPVVAYAVNGVPEENGQRLQGMPNQTPESVLKDLRGSMDAIDRQFSPYVRPSLYAPGTAEPCPRTVGMAYGKHVKPVGKDCPEPKCVMLARKKAAQKARATGITASAVSQILTRQEGFTRAELRYDGTAKTVGFICKGEDHNARVAVMWNGPGDADGLAGDLPRIAAALMRRNYRVEVSRSGRYLVVFAPGSAGTSEREYTEKLGERSAGTSAGEWHPHTGAERADIRTARRVLVEATGYLDQAAEDGDAPDGFRVGPEGWRGICVTWGHATERPRPHTPAGQDWDTALDRIADALRAAGYTCVSRNAVCVKAVPPLQTEAQTIAHVQHTGPLDSFKEAVTLQGFGNAGYTELHSSYAHAGIYAYDHEGAQVGGNHHSRHAAVVALAHHYGVSFPLGVLETGRDGSVYPVLTYDAGACLIGPHTAA